MLSNEKIIIWNPSNASIHFTKHHVSFDQAARVFKDPKRLIFSDPKPNKYNEDRYIAIGTVDRRTLFVVYTISADTLTIISARRLTKRQIQKLRKEARNEGKMDTLF